MTNMRYGQGVFLGFPWGVHQSLFHVQATVSECLTCLTRSDINNAAAEACRAGDAANIPKYGHRHIQYIHVQSMTTKTPSVLSQSNETLIQISYRQACVAGFNGGCSVTVQKVGFFHLCHYSSHCRDVFLNIQ